MGAQNWERPSPPAELLTLRLYLPPPNTNQPTEVMNPTQVPQGNGLSFSAPRGDRASAISSVTDDLGGDNGDRNTHPDIPHRNNVTTPALSVDYPVVNRPPG